MENDKPSNDFVYGRTLLISFIKSIMSYFDELIIFYFKTYIKKKSVNQLVFYVMSCILNCFNKVSY